MSDIVPYRSNPLSLRERRAVGEVREARRPARRAAARLDAAAIVAGVGLAHTEALTVAEVAIIKRQGAVIDERARSIVDSYVVAVTNELVRLSLRGE